MNDSSRLQTTSQQVHALHWILRIAFVMDYIGHGTFGWLQKPVFAKYLSVIGIPPEIGVHYLPWIGAHDYILAIGILLFPTRAFLLWGAAWGLWTALLRPMTGETWWEVLDRGGNYGMPFALFVLAGFPTAAKDWFTRVRTWSLPADRKHLFAWTLRLSTAFTLIGHGAYAALLHKEILAKHWASIGLGPDLFGAGTFLPSVGWFEMTLGVLVLLRPFPALLYFVTAFKIGTELLFPVSGLPPLVPVFEFIERAGSYACPLALALLLQWQTARVPASPTASAHSAPEASPA